MSTRNSNNEVAKAIKVMKKLMKFHNLTLTIGQVRKFKPAIEWLEQNFPKEQLDIKLLWDSSPTTVGNANEQGRIECVSVQTHVIGGISVEVISSGRVRGFDAFGELIDWDAVRCVRISPNGFYHLEEPEAGRRNTRKGGR